MKANTYSLLFAAVMGSVLAAILTAASVVLEPYRRANEQADTVRNILEVLGIETAPDATSEQLLEAFNRNVKEARLGELTVYEYVRDGQVEAVAVPFSGPGMWGPVEGFLSLDPDMRVIRGVVFHKQEETPGLGGQIGSKEFRRRFVGKTIQDSAGTPGIRLRRPGLACADHEVDALTSATMTCDKVEQMLNGAIRQIVRERGQHGR